MKKGDTILYVLCFTIILFQIISCSNPSAKNQPPQDKTQQDKPALSKPPSTYQDTLIIDKSAAVFYHPDSLQLEEIKKIVDSLVFDGTMHEYFYQMRNASIVLGRFLPEIKIIDARNVRYLLFMYDDKKADCIDLDSKNDAYGLILFNRQKPPLISDMANIESEAGLYFSK